jgi:hypothetical protein
MEARRFLRLQLALSARTAVDTAFMLHPRLGARVFRHRILLNSNCSESDSGWRVGTSAAQPPECVASI